MRSGSKSLATSTEPSPIQIAQTEATICYWDPIPSVVPLTAPISSHPCLSSWSGVMALCSAPEALCLLLLPPPLLQPLPLVLPTKSTNHTFKHPDWKKFGFPFFGSNLRLYIFFIVLFICLNL